MYHLVEYNIELCFNTNYKFYIIKVNPVHFDNIDSVIIILLTIEIHIITVSHLNFIHYIKSILTTITLFPIQRFRMALKFKVNNNLLFTRMKSKRDHLSKSRLYDGVHQSTNEIFTSIVCNAACCICNINTSQNITDE